MSTINIPGLRGSIYQRGKDSFRVQLSLGRNAEGRYDIKRETVRGTKQDAIDLLTRWNVEYLDHAIQATNFETVRQAYDEWIEHVREYRTPNTHQFYRARFADLLPELGHRRLKDVTLNDMQKALAKHPTKDRHNKKALSAFMSWCVDNRKVKEHDCHKLKTKAKPQEKSEEDVWNFEQVQRVYSVLTFENLYDILIVLGVECGLRPQEAMALTWDRVHEDYLVIDTAVKERTPEAFMLGTTKNEKLRTVATTPFLIDKLTVHNVNQQLRMANTRGYETEHNLVVADSMGRVPDLKYIRRYVYIVADKAGVNRIPPKNLRSTYVSLLNDLGIPLSIIQQQVGHSSPDITTKHYVRVFDESLRHAAMLLHNRLHS